MEFITKEEQQIIIDWANQNYTTFTKNGKGRQFLILSDTTTAPACIADIKQRLIDEEELHTAKQEPEFGDYISYIQDGGQINKHQIDKEDGITVVRYELYVQLPEIGGLPVIDDLLVRVVERQYARRKPAENTQSCQLVQGSKARIVISFGFVISS